MASLTDSFDVSTLYVSWTLAALLIAIVLENELLPADGATLHYVIVP